MIKLFIARPLRTKLTEIYTAIYVDWHEMEPTICRTKSLSLISETKLYNTSHN